MAKFIFQAGVFFKRPLYPANTSTIVTVYDAETGSIAPVWNDRAGEDPRANPGAIWQEGQIKLYLNAGRYNIVASNGSDSKTWNDVIIVDPDAGGGGGGSGNVPAGGTSGQLLAKASGADYDTEWVAPADGSNRNLVQTVSSVGGVLTIDCSYDYHYISLTENIGLISFINRPEADRGVTLMLFIYQDSTPRTVAWPPSFAFTSGSETEVATGSGDESVLALSSPNGGWSWVATMQYGGA